MDLQAARELKSRLLTSVHTAEGDGAPVRSFAVGIAPRSDGQYAVAIRFTEEQPDDQGLGRLAMAQTILWEPLLLN